MLSSIKKSVWSFIFQKTLNQKFLPARKSPSTIAPPAITQLNFPKILFSVILNYKEPKFSTLKNYRLSLILQTKILQHFPSIHPKIPTKSSQISIKNSTNLQPSNSPAKTSPVSAKSQPSLILPATPSWQSFSMLLVLLMPASISPLLKNVLWFQVSL